MRAAAFAWLIAWASPATACPFCSGGPGGDNPVKAAIFNGDFWNNLGAVALPFVLLLGLTSVIYFGGSRSDQ
jgi:hypothetical protein